MLGSIDFWLSIASIVIPVFVTIYTVNNRIKNENIENHQPYVVLEKLDKLDSIDVYKYYLTFEGKNYKAPNTEKVSYDIKLLLRNIGYGVATNIKFYNLLTGKQCEGNVEQNLSKNQKLFTTFDMASLEIRNIQASINASIIDDEGNKIEEYTKILCVYKDLHNNIYSFIININLKSKEHYDFYAYQPSSSSYKRAILENKKHYNKIIRSYKEL